MKPPSPSFSLQSRKSLLFLLAIGNTIAFATWQVLLNNFAVERAAFTGEEIGILQSLREVPGFLAFTAIFVMIFLRQQTFAVLSLITLGIGTAITAFYPTALWLYLTTVLMSIGFHYLETLHNSLSLQWLSKEEAPKVLGQLLSVRAICTLVILGTIYFYFMFFEANYFLIYILAGGTAVIIGIFCWTAIPHFEDRVVQKKSLFLRRQYWLYYLLTFLAGARRQIFVVFAGFLMVEKFGYSVSDVAALYLVNHLFNWAFAGRIGALVGRIGERRALTFEYCGLICVFTAYAFVDNAYWAAGLYVLDHLFFSLAIAIKTYFQKIADPADMASTAGVAFTINHIAAVFIPALFGLIWLVSPMTVFLLGAVMAAISLILARNIPRDPREGNEVVLGKVSSITATG
ncbi:MAG: MFS transporter [Porticoccaceae bacterium]|nr:MFS transporter [Porticoccaceae bacterium]